ncbi:hypothetical protein [Streptacidiphilus sp. PAMC 29251]
MSFTAALTALLCAVPVWAAVPAVAAGSPTPAVTQPDAGPADPWVLTNTSFSPEDYTTSPFVGNGYLSQRVSAVGQGYQQFSAKSGWPLYTPRSTTALVAGVYQDTSTATSIQEELISALPTWSTMNLGVGDQNLDAKVSAAQITDYRQTLDLRKATVTTSMTWTPSAGKSTAVTFDVAANRDVMHLGQVQVTVTPAWSGGLSLSGLIDGQDAQRVNPASRSVDTAADTSTVNLVSPGTNTAVTETQLMVAGPGATVSARAALTPAGSAATAGEQWSVPVTAGQTYTFTKYVGISTSNDPGDPGQVAAATVTAAAASGWTDLMTRHQGAWSQLWAPNVAVTGRNDVQTAANSAFYLLYSSLRAGVSFSIPPPGCPATTTPARSSGTPTCG